MASVALTVAAGGHDLSAVMDGHFGRAERFLVVDSESGEVLQLLDNPVSNSALGAGTGVAGLMKQQGVEEVISGRFGPKAFNALTGLGIGGWIAPPGMIAEQALRLLQRGQLERMQAAAL